MQERACGVGERGVEIVKGEEEACEQQEAEDAVEPEGAHHGPGHGATGIGHFFGHVDGGVHAFGRC